MKARGDAQPRHPADRTVKHIAAPGHHKTNMGVVFQYFGRSLNKIFGTFLVRDTPKERDYFILYAAFHVHRRIALKIDGVVYRNHFLHGYPITVDDDIAGEVTHCNDLIGLYHSPAFDVVHLCVDIFTATVKLGGVDMNYQRLPRYFFRHNTGNVSQPVMGVNYIELFVQRHGGRHQGITRHFLQKVGAVLSRKLVFLSESDNLVFILRTFNIIVHQRFKFFRPKIRNKIRSYLEKVDMLPKFFQFFDIGEDFNVACVKYPHGGFVLITRSVRHHKQYLHLIFG